MNNCIIRGAWIYDHPGLLRSSYRDHDSPRSLWVVSFRLVLPPKTYRTLRGGSLHNSFPASVRRSAYLSSKTAGFRLVLPHRTSPMPLPSSPMPLPLLHGGSWSGGPRNCRSADCLHVLSFYSGNIIGLRLVFPHRILPATNRAIRGKGYLSDQPTSTQRDGEGAGKTVNLLGFRIVAPVAIAPPSQQPKVMSLISIAVCDDGSVSIHIGKQQGL